MAGGKTLVRFVVTGALTGSLCGTTALAEVCDKIRPNLDPASGPVSIAGEAVYSIISLPGLVVVATWVASLILGRLWLLVLSGILSLAYATLLASSPSLGGEVYELAVQEGCVNSPQMAVAAYLIIALIAFLRAGWVIRSGDRLRSSIERQRAQR